ncbi:hypothetical protein I6A60_01695 [Frankia sp. AgB1.9]|uniref:hypothetical protein n=1 Tax=unclassified Frankia TaxID=2632575 RepID=UPI001932EB59|nr:MULTISPECIES: hypothetical protein [unclassified Frankia]MBL7491320.1 hypothetical protein [Frankia sp. AgW1.1]MBL7546598.1 hypothetical protein [Frankia sp. AgB1.9]MBL7624668.1 hypothetical protein [Frankia sp. AgB1.8]
MPNLSVSVREATLADARARAEAAGVTLSAWVDQTLTDAIWTARWREQQTVNRELGVDDEWLAREYASREGLDLAG